MEPSEKFRNRVAIVTGASSGIGRATSLALAREGASLVLLSRARDRLEKLADEIKTKYGQDSLVIPADVCSASDIEKMVPQIMDRCGRIDCLVNSAGFITYKPFSELSLDEHREMMAVNYFGTVICIKAVLPVMIRQKSGHIVNIASTAGRRGFPMETGYCASKFALVGFSEALRVELHGTGVGISMICPGIVDTPMAAGFLGLPGIREMVRPIPVDRIASYILKAVAEARPEVILPFSTKMVIRLNAVAPRWADWIIRRRAKRIAERVSRLSSSH